MTIDKARSGSIQAAWPGARGDRASDRTGDKATYSMGAGMSAWSCQLIKACDWSQGPEISMQNTLISKTAWRWAGPALQDDCARGGGCNHIKLSQTFTPSSAFMTSSPVILARNLKSPEPASSKVIWILSTGLQFCLSQPVTGTGSSWSRSSAAECAACSIRSKGSRHREVQVGSGGNQGSLLANGCRELNY